MRIRTEHLSFCYEGGRPAVQDISLDIPTGTLTVLCGVNGSGKSTLLRLLADLAQPSSGQILYDHGKKTDYKTAEAVSMVFQQPETQLFAGTVHKDIEYGLMEREVSKEKRTEIIAGALAKTGLAYDEFAGRSPFLLSGGEKRRVCIAGALAVQPGLLILDEPTAGLDPQAAQALLEMVQELRSGGLTLIIGTHDLDSFLPVADKVIVMKQGAIHYNGPAPALTADPGLLADAGLTPPVYASMGRRAVQHGLLEAVPDNLEEPAVRAGKAPAAYAADGQVASRHWRLCPQQRHATRQPEYQSQRTTQYGIQLRRHQEARSFSSILQNREGSDDNQAWQSKTRTEHPAQARLARTRSPGQMAGDDSRLAGPVRDEHSAPAAAYRRAAGRARGFGQHLLAPGLPLLPPVPADVPVPLAPVRA